jgi:hypothetical protein
MTDQPGTRIAHPYREGVIVVALLCALFAVLTAVAGGLTLSGWLTGGWTIVLAFLLAWWLLLLVLIWAWGMRKLWQMRAFLRSTRPLIRWWYTPEEWSAIQAAEEPEQRAGLLLAPGCLAVLFAIVGVLVGGMLGAETGTAEAVLGGGLGLFIGAAIGGVLGGTIAGGNYLAYRWARQHDRQVCVALGATEILYRRMYFRSNGVTHFIEKVSLPDELPPVLLIEVWNPKPRGASAETWSIPVPEPMLDPLREVLPAIHTRAHRGGS